VKDFIESEFPSLRVLDPVEQLSKNTPLVKTAAPRAPPEILVTGSDDSLKAFAKQQFGFNKVSRLHLTGARLTIVDVDSNGKFTPNGLPVIVVAEDDAADRGLYIVALESDIPGASQYQFVFVNNLEAVYKAIEIAQDAGFTVRVISDNDYPKTSAPTSMIVDTGKELAAYLLKKKIPFVLLSGADIESIFGASTDAMRNRYVSKGSFDLHKQFIKAFQNVIALPAGARMAARKENKTKNASSFDHPLKRRDFLRLAGIAALGGLFKDEPTRAAKEPVEAKGNDLWRNHEPVQGYEGVKKIISITHQWMEANREIFEARDIEAVENYFNYFSDPTKTNTEESLGISTLGKHVEPGGPPKIVYNSAAMKLVFEAAKKYEASQSVFIEVVAASVLREAWGLKLYQSYPALPEKIVKNRDKFKSEWEGKQLPMTHDNYLGYLLENRQLLEESMALEIGPEHFEEVSLIRFMADAENVGIYRLGIVDEIVFQKDSPLILQQLHRDYAGSYRLKDNEIDSFLFEMASVMAFHMDLIKRAKLAPRRAIPIPGTSITVSHYLQMQRERFSRDNTVGFPAQFIDEILNQSKSKQILNPFHLEHPNVQKVGTEMLERLKPMIQDWKNRTGWSAEGGRLASARAQRKAALIQYFIENKIDKEDAEKAAATLLRKIPSTRNLLLQWGVLTRDEASVLDAPFSDITELVQTAVFAD
jgi:hypothetical protein